MVDDNGTNKAMAPPPPMPPSVTLVLWRGGGALRTTSACQNCSPTAASRGKLTPPSRIVQVQPGTRSSAISLLSASHEVHSASTLLSSIPINLMDAFDLSDSSAEDDDAPSPEKAPPDFRTRKSDEDSVATGDDSAGWEMEEDRVMNSFLAQTEAEEALDDLSVNVPMTDVHEFMLISEEEGEDGTEGQASGAAEVAPITVEYKARRVVLQTANVKTLKAIAIMFKLSPHGKKQLLVWCKPGWPKNS